MVGAVSYKMFAMVIAWKKEDGRETIVDQRDVDIGKAADDFKLTSSIDYNNYLEGTRCLVNELKGVRSKYCIFVCSERMMQRDDWKT